jgi:hypothetical protein
VTDTYDLLSQFETVTVQVAAGGVPVTGGQVTFTDNGQTQTVTVKPDGQASATFTFNLFELQENPNVHTITATYSDGTRSTLIASSGSPNTVLDFLFQIFIDYEIVKYALNHPGDKVIDELFLLYGTPAGSELGPWAGAAFLAIDAHFGYQ